MIERNREDLTDTPIHLLRGIPRPQNGTQLHRRRLQVGDVWEAVLHPRVRQAGALADSDVDDNVDYDVVDTSDCRRLPVVDSILIGKILAQAETQISDQPGFFFGAMPVQRTPKSTGKSKANLTASARKRKGKPPPPKDGAPSSVGSPQTTDPKDTDTPPQPGGTEGSQPQQQAPPKKDSCPGGGSKQQEQQNPSLAATPGGSGKSKETPASGPQPSGGATAPPGPSTRLRPPEVVQKEGVTPSQGSAKGNSPRKLPSDRNLSETRTKKLVGESDKRTDKAMSDDIDTSVNSSASSDKNDSLSFGSDTDLLLGEMYAIIDPEVKSNGLLSFGSLLRPGIIQAVTQALDEDVVEKNVIFPVFTRYFSSKGKAFENMIADLLHHREANQNGGAPLILRVDVPRLRQIANKIMVFLKATYRAFKVGTDEEEKANADLIKVHMKIFVKHYHALIPQIDLIATQWGVTLEDTLSQDDLGSLRTEGSRQSIED
jgi:hypothetical protein